jgi:hypothetical protein
MKTNQTRGKSVPLPSVTRRPPDRQKPIDLMVPRLEASPALTARSGRPRRCVRPGKRRLHQTRRPLPHATRERRRRPLRLSLGRPVPLAQLGRTVRLAVPHPARPPRVTRLGSRPGLTRLAAMTCGHKGPGRRGDLASSHPARPPQGQSQLGLPPNQAGKIHQSPLHQSPLHQSPLHQSPLGLNRRALTRGHPGQIRCDQIGDGQIRRGRSRQGQIRWGQADDQKRSGWIRSRCGSLGRSRPGPTRRVPPDRTHRGPTARGLNRLGGPTSRSLTFAGPILLAPMYPAQINPAQIHPARSHLVLSRRVQSRRVQSRRSLSPPDWDHLKWTRQRLSQLGSSLHDRTEARAKRLPKHRALATGPTKCGQPRRVRPARVPGPAVQDPAPVTRAAAPAVLASAPVAHAAAPAVRAPAVRAPAVRARAAASRPAGRCRRHRPNPLPVRRTRRTRATTRRPKPRQPRRARQE